MFPYKIQVRWLPSLVFIISSVFASVEASDDSGLPSESKHGPTAFFGYSAENAILMPQTAIEDDTNAIVVNSPKELERTLLEDDTLTTTNTNPLASTNATDRELCFDQMECASCIATLKSDGTSCQWYSDTASGVQWCQTGGCNDGGVCGTGICELPESNAIVYEVEKGDGSTIAGIQVGNSTFELEADELQDVNVTLDEETGSTAITDEEATTVLSEVENEDGTTRIVNWTFSAQPSESCAVQALYCIPVSKFTHLPVFKHGHVEGQEPEEGTRKEWKSQIMDECTNINMFLPGLPQTVAESLVERYSEFKNSTYMIITVSGSGVDITMYAIGAVVADVESIDYLSGQFKVDLRVYIQRVTHRAPYDSISDSMEAGWTTTNRSSVASTSDQGHFRLLPDELLYVRDQVGSNVKVIKDGRCSAEASKTFQPVSLEEYDALSGGLAIRRSSANLVPVTDGNNDILYLTAHGASIKFQPVNSEFFPFQVNILDITITSPASKFWLGKPASVYTFCIAGPYTGFTYPIPSLPNNGELNMIPTILTENSPPWFNAGNDHMHLDSTAFSTSEEDLSEKHHQAANFRIIYSDKSILNSWMTLLPFMFTAFTTQLQWLVTKPENCDASSMITSVLLIQNLVNSQSAFTGYHSIATEVIYMTYAVTGVYVTAVAFMTFINISKQNGQREALSTHQLEIFRYFRLVGVLMTPLYIPILVITSEDDTGEQHKYPWLWPLVMAFVLAVLGVRILFDLRNLAHERMEAMERAKQDIESLAHLSNRTMSSYSAKEVKHWISHSKELTEALSFFTKEELKSIANKFYEAKIDGHSLLRSACDPKTLVQFVGLPVGQAINFSDAFNKLLRGGSIKLDQEAPFNVNNESTRIRVSKIAAGGNSLGERTSSSSHLDARGDEMSDRPEQPVIVEGWVVDEAHREKRKRR